MSIIPAPQDYTDLDFTSIRIRISTLITAAFPEWSDTERSRFENAILDAFAYMFDVLAYYLDNRALQTRWGTATMRYSMIELARLIEYDLDTRTPATADIIFSIATTTAGNVNIATGTTIRTLGSTDVVKFQSQASATILAGNLNSAATLSEHSAAQSESFTASGYAGEEFVLSYTPFIDASDSLEIAAVPWTRVSHFVDSGPTDLHYKIWVDENDQAIMKTGDGTNGAIPTPGAAVDIAYKTGGGEEGNVDANSLTKVEGGPFYDVLGNRVTLTANNALAASGGDARESVAEARVRAPRSIRVLNRCIARTDWEDLAIQVSGVARALAVSANELTGVPTGQMWTYIVRDDLVFPIGALLTTVETYIDTNYPTPVVCTWEARTPPTVTVNVTRCYVYLLSGYVAATVATNIRTALSEFFNPTDANGDPNLEVDFGHNYKDATGAYEGILSLDKLENVISDVAGIRRMGTPADAEDVQLNGASDDVTLAENEWPITGTIEIRNGDGGAIIYTGTIR